MIIRKCLVIGILLIHLLHNYLVNIGTTIASQLPTPDTSFESFFNNRCPNNLLSPMLQDEIVDIINKITCAKPLALIFNKSITSGIFPDCLNVGKVIRIYKKGSKNEIGNYRPTCITVLPIFTKVFEKLIFNHLISYMYVDNNGILSDSQFGFRKNRSTEMRWL